MIFRTFYLIIIFTPVGIFYPISKLFGEWGEEKWLSLLIFCIECAGSVFIKIAQYASHRRDLIGDNMAERFIKLREQAPRHSFQDTEKAF
jgi:aarF domain-containing kinase